LIAIACARHALLDIRTGPRLAQRARATTTRKSEVQKVARYEHISFRKLSIIPNKKESNNWLKIFTPFVHRSSGNNIAQNI
jgi:hypothetical protein